MLLKPVIVWLYVVCNNCSGNKAPNQMTEEEWLKRQEALERRRMRSLRDKREAEETVKAKIRKAVTARFRGKLIAQAGGKEDVSGSEGEGAPAADKTPKVDTKKGVS